MEYLRIYESKKGGWVDLHPLHGNDELPGNAEAARVLADHGYQVQLLPSINEKDIELRRQWLYDVIGTKNPDVRIDNDWVGDIKRPDKADVIRKSVISRGIYECAQQKVQIAIINLFDRDYTLQDVKKGIVGALQPERNKSILFVFIITKQGNLFIVDRALVFDDSIYEALSTL